MKTFLIGISGYANIRVTLSSVLWNAELLRKVELLSHMIPIKNVQITYVTDCTEKLSAIIPIFKQKEYSFHEVISFIQQSDKDYYRINYILIKGVNDHQDDFNRFISYLKDIKDKMMIRISKLNETEASKRNELYSTTIETMEQMNQFLQNAGIHSYVFYARKNDHMNCGQLITENKEE